MSNLWNRWNAKSMRHAMVGATVIVGATAAIGAASVAANVAATNFGTRTVGMQIPVSNLCGLGSGELVITATATSTVINQAFDGTVSPVLIDTNGMTPGAYTVQASCLGKDDLLSPSDVIDTFTLVPLTITNIGSFVPGTGITVPIGCGATDAVLVRWGIPPTNPSDPSTGVLIGQATLPTPAPATYTVTDPTFVEGRGYTALVYCTPVSETISSVPTSGILFTFASLAPVTTAATTTTTAPAPTSTIAPTTRLPATGRSSDGTLALGLLLVGVGAGTLAVTRRAQRQ